MPPLQRDDMAQSRVDAPGMQVLHQRLSGGKTGVLLHLHPGPAGIADAVDEGALRGVELLVHHLGAPVGIALPDLHRREIEHRRRPGQGGVAQEIPA